MTDAPDKCPDCYGSGKVADPNAAACDPKYVPCPKCNGTGKQKEEKESDHE